ncbi:hypothetical protein [Paraglaciecola marina]|uniref:hypothetical protein n=1 Tax=Paraglaciecola marina TaxID=2500157 RepID=UPI00105DAC5C|nr:hypothetical protein [Paraglaciecola marina]
MKTLKYGPSIYFYHDKAIFDGLSQNQVTKANIFSLLFQKNVLFSSLEVKDDASFYLSSYMFDYYDKTKLAEFLSVSPRRENISSTSIDNANDDGQMILDETKVKNCLDIIKTKVSSKGDSNAKIVKKSDSFILEVNYKDYDLTKPEMRQVVPKTSLIEVEFSGGELNLRSPANDFSMGLVSELKLQLNSIAGKNLKQFSIDLSGVSKASQVSDFFRKLISNIDDYKLYDVTNVKLHHPEIEGDDDAITSRIKKAMLHGEGVLSSPELKSLFERGFYVSHIQWESLEVGTASDKVSFEASLKNPEEKNGFTYQVRFINRYSERTKNFVQKSDAPSNLEKKQLHKKIESAARNAYQAIFSQDIT